MSGETKATEQRSGTTDTGDAGTPSGERQLPDAKQRTIEHGATEYFREEGTPSDGQPLQPPDPERKASEKLRPNTD